MNEAQQKELPIAEPVEDVMLIYAKMVTDTLREVVDSSEKTNYLIETKDTIQERSPFPSPGKVGFLPQIEKQMQVRAALTGKTAPHPTRYAEPEEPMQKTITRQEIKHGVPYARCIIFLDATIEGLLSADKRQRALDQAIEVLRSYSEIKAGMPEEVYKRSVECYIRAQTVAGTTYVINPYRFTPREEDVYDTTQEDADSFLTNLPDWYTWATKRTVGLRSDVEKEHIESIDFKKDPLSNENRAWMQRPEPIGEKAFGYAPAVVAITIAPGKDVQIAKIPGERVTLPEKR